MLRRTVLLADNNESFVGQRRLDLEQAGFRVVTANNPLDAKRVLDRGEVDLALIDLRLLEDTDDEDISGLTVARETSATVPKIILTAFPSEKNIYEALQGNLDGLPAAVDFVRKQDGPQKMLTAVRRALNLKVGSGIVAKEVTDQLTQDHQVARQQARWNYIAALAVALIGAVITFGGVILTLRGTVDVGITTTIAGVITEFISVLFFRRADVANARSDRYHHEMLQVRLFEILMAASGELQDEDASEREAKEKLIEQASAKWLNVPNVPQ